jgi:ubiquinol-cytochrome c reductase cytochrome b subunit
MRRLIIQLGEWFDRRLQLAAPIREIAEHPVPKSTASWWYVFGSAALVVFLLQLVTGIMLAFVYVPSASEAWNSLQSLNHDVSLGWFIRAMHGWGSNFMVAIVLIHMAQVFLFGAYKFPRELTWVIGVFLLLMTLGMAFTGQVLRFDQDAYWGLGIGASIASRVPVLGPAIVKLMLGGPIIAGATLSRFFALHVFVIPGMLIAFVAVHLLLVLKLGINEWPMPGRIVKKATYEKEYHELTHKDGAPFVPYAVWKDLFFAAFILLAVAACAAFFGPFGPTGQPDPTIIQTAPKPDYFFLCRALFPASIYGDARSAHRSSHRDRRFAASPIFVRRRRKKLAPAPDCCSHHPSDRRYTRNLHSSRGIYPMEPAHERMER